MDIYSVYDPAFRSYGRVVEGMETSVQEILTVLASTPLPERVVYTPEEPALMDLPAAEEISARLYGGMSVQLGWCNGHNTRLNCLEYHRSSEFNLGTEDFILLLAKQWEIRDGRINTEKVMSFRVPAGVLVEVYATSLHYAPCHCTLEKGFRVLVALPWGTNTGKPSVQICSWEDRLLWACNKWLLAHENSVEAGQGAYVGLVGENIDFSDQI